MDTKIYCDQHYMCVHVTNTLLLNFVSFVRHFSFILVSINTFLRQYIVIDCFTKDGYSIRCYKDNLRQYNCLK